MRLEQEVNIYGDAEILKRFQADETSISVVQGNISAMISESEIIELQNSHTTMYSQVADLKLNVSDLTLNFSDLQTKYNTVTEQYTEMESKVAEYKAGVDGLSVNITQVQQNLEENYSTTSVMTAAINAKADEIELSVSGNYTQKDQIISTINLSPEDVSISASKINLNGVVTANSYFKILTDGSMETIRGKIGGWTISANQLSNNQSDFSVKIQAPTVYGTSGLGTADVIAVHDLTNDTWPFVVTSDGSMDLGDEFQYRPNGFAYDATVQMNLGGWQIKKAQDAWGYDEVIYWDTIESQTNGIGAKGPWVIWGGWNGGSSLDYVNNYKFVVSDQGNVYGQRFYDNGQQLLPIVVEVTHKTLTNDFCYVSKSGYYLLACYLIRSVDHNIYVKAIQYRNDNTYTIAFQGANGGEVDLYTMWAKMPD